MKVKFLGTGASEGIPSMYCKCSVCENARKIGGKEIRSRMGMLIDDSLMIDFPPDSFFNAIRYGINFSLLKGILITHTHSDHLALEDISPKIKLEEDNGSIWDIYATSATVEKLVQNNCVGNLRINKVELKVPFTVADYKITPLDANHITNEDSALYLIEKDGKTYLHLSDTGELNSCVYDYLSKKCVKVDLAVIDCTYGLLEKEYHGHLNLNQVARIKNEFIKLGVFSENTKIYATHVCHWGGSHEELEKKALTLGINVAYDGLTIEL